MKKFLSLLLCSIMVLSLLPGRMIAANAEGTGNRVKAPLFNSSNYQDTDLFKKYIRSAKGGKPWANALTMSAGPLFAVKDMQNSYYRYSYGFNEKDENVSLLWNTRFLRHNDGESWSAKFKFKMKNDPNGEYGDFIKMLDAGQIKMRFGGNFYNYGGGRPSMKFMDKGIDGSSLPDNATVERDSGWFSVTKEELLNNEIIMSGPRGGTNAAINHPYVQFADLTKPGIKGASVENGTLYLDMGEPLKEIGNLSDMKLNLILSDRETGVQDNECTAVATRVEGSKIVFSIDDKKNGKEIKEYQVTKIKSFECSNNDYSSELMGIALADEYLFSTYYQEVKYKSVNNAPGGMGEYTKSSTPVTDLAGNSVEITAKDLTPYKLVVDRINPVIAGAEVSGSMISEDLTKYSQASEWREDIDRSSVFAGVGDTLTLSLITSEEIKNGGNVSVKLNINDENGNPISLRHAKLENMYDGVNKRAATRIEFEPFTVTDKMRAANEKQPISPVEITANGVRDYYGNELKTAKLSITPQQQIFLDNKLPTVEIRHITKNETDTEFCIPITLSDGGQGQITSGFIGLSADFAWVYGGSAQHEYKYALTTSTEAPSKDEFKTASLTNEKNPVWNSSGGLTQSDYYLHIQTNADEIGDTALKFRLSDWAGNSGEVLSKISDINIDKTAPQIELISINTSYTTENGSSQAEVKADFSLTDFNMNGLTARYKIADSKNEDDIANMDEAAVTDGKFSVSAICRETSDKVLIVTATDCKGNTSQKLKIPFSVDLNKAAANYTINSDLSKLNTKPDIQVSAPNNPNGKSVAQTRVILKMGDDYYARVYDTDDKNNIFDFDGTWYKVTYSDDMDKFATVETLGDKTEMSGYYGTVNVSFDSAFADLTPVQDKSVMPPSDSQEAATYRSEGGFNVLYAPPTDGLHNVEFDAKFTSDGKELEPSGNSTQQYVIRQNSMSDVRLGFKISNMRVADWKIKNIDFDKSYVSVTKLGESEAVYTAKLSQNDSQTFSMPDWDKDGKRLTTGAYYVTVYICQTGSETPQEFKFETAVLLDSVIPSADTGIKQYYILPEDNFKNVSSEARRPEINKESETPFKVINLGAAAWKETERNEDEAYSVTTDGFQQFKMTLSTEDVSKNILGVKVGEIEGFRLWNKAYKDGDKLPFTTQGGSGGSYSKTFGLSRAERFENPLDGVPANGDLQLEKGLNTICYQVKLKNGNISPIYEMTINVTENAPQIAVDMNMNESQKYETDADGSIHVLSVDASVTNAFSPNGDVKLYYINKGKEAHSSTARFDKINLGETVKFSADSGQKYQTYTDKDNENTSNACYAFMAIDESGNSTIIYPQFRQPMGDVKGTKYIFETEMLKPTIFARETGNYSFYRYALDSTGVDLSKSTLSVNDGPEMPLLNPSLPNNYGYVGAVISGDKSYNNLKLDFAVPWNEEKAKNDEYFITKLTVKRVGIHGDTRTETYEVSPEGQPSNFRGIQYSAPEYRVYSGTTEGTRIDFNSYVKVKGDDDYTAGIGSYYPIFSDGKYDIAVTDALGNERTISVEVKDKWGEGPKVNVSPLYTTRGNVTVTAEYAGGVTLTEENGSLADITNNESDSVAVVKQPTDLIMKWSDSQGVEQERKMHIGNNGIKPIEPEIRWDYSDSDIVNENCVYESVTATVIDKNGSVLKDAVTGEALEHTFYPGGETEYTFSGYVNQHGTGGTDITAKLPVTVIEYPAPSEWKDTTAPSVQMLGYTVKSSIAEDKKLVLNLYDEYNEWSNPALINYGEGYTVTEDASSFIDKMGFAEQYRFNVYAADESAVKLIAKEGLVDDKPKFTDSSDNIDGVNISGRAVDITKNVQFTLFAVDSSDNAKAIQFDIDSIGKIPEPVAEKVVSNDGTTVKVYLVSKDSGVTDIVMKDNSLGLTPQRENDGEYKDAWYLTAKENCSVTINCDYKYMGKDTKASISVDITEIDDKNAVGKLIWSANADSSKTNKDVTAQIRFDKTIKAAVWADSPSKIPEMSMLDNQITLTYSENIPEQLTLVCTSLNGKTTDIVLHEVKNIDKTAPAITPSVKLTATAKSARIEFSADEDVVFTENGTHGRSFERTVTANGKYVYHFADEAGNITETEVWVNDIVDTPLYLEFSLSENGSDIKPPGQFKDIRVGDKVYIRANRDCEINWIGSTEKTLISADKWTAIEITEDNAGFAPGIRAADKFDTRYYHFTQILPPDRIAPMISLKKNTVDVSLALDEDKIKDELKKNVSVTDNSTAADKIKVDVSYTRPETASTVSVKYTAEDESGNSAEKYGYVHFFRDTELKISVNGDGIFREMVKVCGNKTQSIVIDSGGEPYSVYMKNGIKTAGQMKIGSTVLAKDKSDNAKIDFVPKKAGYYTFLVRTQGQDAYRFVLYVKDVKDGE